MSNLDRAVTARTAVVGTAAGAATGALTMIVFLVGAAIVVDDVKWGQFAAGLLPTTLLAAVIGAVIGLSAGVVAGLILLLPAAKLRHRPTAGRFVCALVCAGTLGLPQVVVGIGWNLWLATPYSWLVAGGVLVAGAVGAWTGPYLLAGRRTCVITAGSPTSKPNCPAVNGSH